MTGRADRINDKRPGSASTLPGLVPNLCERSDVSESTLSVSACAVEECVRQTRTKGSSLCNAHYFQQWRNGRITSPQIKPYATPGCKEPGCGNPHEGLGWCSMHHTRYVRHGDPQAYRPVPMPSGAAHHAWRGTEAGYGSSHDRVKRRLGPASEYACQHCGKQALHWAYDHADPDERTDPRGIRYGTDPAHYLPLCPTCHKRFDQAHIQTQALAVGIVIGLLLATQASPTPRPPTSIDVHGV